MEDTTKGGLVAGGVVALLGAIATFFAYKQGHASGHTDGLAEGFSLAEEKFKGLKEKYEELQEQIRRLKEFKVQIEQERDGSRAMVGELYNLLKDRRLINDELYNKLVNDLWGGKIDGFSEIIDAAINAEQEASNVINGGAGKGMVTHKRNVEEKELVYDCYEFRISFSDTIRGIYEYPPFEEVILPPDSMLLSSPKLLARVKELIPGWRFDLREGRQLQDTVAGLDFRNGVHSDKQAKEKYDYECICKNALRELEGQYVLCNKVKFSSKFSWDSVSASGGSNELDYEHGVVTSEWLDNYIRQKCREVRDATSAFLSMLSVADKERLTRNQSVLNAITKNQSISGTIDFVDNSPYVRFSDDICVRLVIPNLAIYFEGDNFGVHTNDDLRRELHDLIPDWNDMPISDSRIDKMLSSFRNVWNRKSHPLPAEGAIRQFLRFKDAAEVLCDKALRDMVGKQITCQSVELKRSDGVISKSSSAHSPEVEKMLCDVVARVQERLNELAKSRNAVLYCYGDLFPELKTPRYYEKWRVFDKTANMPQLRVGDIVNGVVRNIKEYGAFIDFAGTSGLLHISEISNVFIKDINAFLKIGQSVEVKIIGIDAAKGHISLSMKQLKSS